MVSVGGRVMGAACAWAPSSVSIPLATRKTTVLALISRTAHPLKTKSVCRMRGR